MRFWDSSALVPLLVQESLTAPCEALLLRDPRMAVWWGAHTECAAALIRKAREEGSARPALTHGLRRLDALAAAWDEVRPGVEMRKTALRVLQVHTLRTADALQLAAALMACGHDSSRMDFVCADNRLREAAEKEGFRILPESPD